MCITGYIFRFLFFKVSCSTGCEWHHLLFLYRDCIQSTALCGVCVCVCVCVYVCVCVCVYVCVLCKLCVMHFNANYYREYIYSFEDYIIIMQLQIVILKLMYVESDNNYI